MSWSMPMELMVALWRCIWSFSYRMWSRPSGILAGGGFRVVRMYVVRIEDGECCGCAPVPMTCVLIVALVEPRWSSVAA